jgi:hypothetical protein
MDNHPIPQDVTGFQFRLIGNMTVKQFGYLAVASIIAWGAFQLPISIFIRLPISFVFAFLGIALAFLPVAGRPMDIMIANYIKALFRPTQYIYQKSADPFFHVSQKKPIQDNQAPNFNAESAKPVSPPIQHIQPQAHVASFPVSSQPTKPLPLKPPKNVGVPAAPEYPNVVVGITRDPRGNPLGNILIEIKDKDDNPVRAFKTNEVGRFASATPLSNGEYQITFDDPKEQNRFEPKALNVTGQIIPPIIAASIDTREELRRSLFNN